MQVKKHALTISTMATSVDPATERETEHHALAIGPGAWSSPTCAYARLPMASKT
jgi:hypothetical protein